MPQRVAFLALAAIGLFGFTATATAQPYPGRSLRLVVPFAPGGGVGHYAKLLLIPVAMACAFTPRQGLQIGYGFLAGCLVVLVLSFLSFFLPMPPPFRQAMDGVPVKDNAVQSGCFALCAFALALGGVSAWVGGNRRRAAVMLILALVFLADIFMIFISKTGILMTAALVALFVVQAGGSKRSLLIATPIVIRRTMAGLGRAAAQAEEIDIDRRGTRLPLQGVPSEIVPLVSAVNGALRRLDDGYERHQRFLVDAAHELAAEPRGGTEQPHRAQPSQSGVSALAGRNPGAARFAAVTSPACRCRHARQRPPPVSRSYRA